MRKLLLFSLCVLLFASCSVKDDPEYAVKNYYENLIKRDYREAFKYIDFGEDANNEEIEAKLSKLETDVPAEVSDSDVIDYEIISQEKKQTKDGEEYISFTVKEFSKDFPEGHIEEVPVHKDSNGEWKIFISQAFAK